MSRKAQAWILAAVIAVLVIAPLVVAIWLSGYDLASWLRAFWPWLVMAAAIAGLIATGAVMAKMRR